MKTYLTYGAGLAVASLLFTLLMYFAGYHTDAAKMQTGVAQVLGSVAPLAISIVFIVLGIKARRSEVPVTEPFGYGQAFGAGMMTAVFAVLLGLVTSYLYFAVINPDFSDIVYQAQVAKMEEKGMPAAQIEKAEPIMRKMMSPPIMTAMGAVMGLFGSTIISLIAAAFLKRPAPDEPNSL